MYIIMKVYGSNLEIECGTREIRNRNSVQSLYNVIWICVKNMLTGTASQYLSELVHLYSPHSLHSTTGCYKTEHYK